MIFDKYPELLFITSQVSDGDMINIKNRREFLSKHNISMRKTVGMKQSHGNSVIAVDKSYVGRNDLDGDALITNNEGIFVMVKVADCHQIGIFDPKHQAIGLLHAGWQGLDQGIIQKTIDAMKENFKSTPKDLLIQFGPSIGPCCYRKLPDLKQENDPRWKLYIFKDKDGTFGIDIWTLAADQLKTLGVLPKNIDNPKICTYHNKKYFSSRRAAVEGGNRSLHFVTVLGMRI